MRQYEIASHQPTTAIDLRSDTVTRPGEAMRQAMAQAEVGDDVYADDPTVLVLQERIADLMGFPAALFVSSGTQSNLCALLSHCGRGDEYIAGQHAHAYRMEGGGAAVLGGIQPQPLEHRADGTLDPAEIEAAIKPDDPHYARTRLLCLENTINGRPLSVDYLASATDLARSHGLATHLDGARLFNAAVVSGGDDPFGEARRIAGHFDSVSVCFSKGLGAPVGSALLGSADLVARARRWRKALGGGMRQAGVLAAAALYALDHHVPRLAEDHDNAALFAEGIKDIPGLVVEPAQTNMVFVETVPDRVPDDLTERFARRGLLCGGGSRLRFVFHLDVSRADVQEAVNIVRDTLAEAAV